VPGAWGLEYKGQVVSSFPERVYAIVLEVPPGCVITYGAIARVLGGDPRKAREVGWAMAATPRRQPPIPAHRVIKMGGELSGGHAFGGYDIQRARLEAEGVSFLEDGRVDLDRHLWLPDEASDVRKQKSEIRRPPKRTV
jgi:methylated-DNA-protein-cysteine methyltransferase-like protein